MVPPRRSARLVAAASAWLKARARGRWMVVGLLALACAGARLWPAPRGRGLTRPEHVVATAFEQRDVSVKGIRLRYIDEGPKSGPALLLIPGHTSRIEEYDAIVPTLTPTHRVLVFDFPGTGYSDKPERDYSLELYEDVAIGFLDALAIDRADVAGGSLGGNLALRLGWRFPSRFRRLVSWSPGSIWRPQPLVAAVGRAIACYSSFLFVSRVQSRYWYSDRFPGRERMLRDTFDYYDEIVSPGFVSMYWGLATSQAGFSLRDIVHDIRHPVLLMWGDADPTPGMAEGIPILHGRLPHSELEVFPNAGHALAAEVPEALGSAISEFLDRPIEGAPPGGP